VTPDELRAQHARAAVLTGVEGEIDTLEPSTDDERAWLASVLSELTPEQVAQLVATHIKGHADRWTLAELRALQRVVNDAEWKLIE